MAGPLDESYLVRISRPLGEAEPDHWHLKRSSSRDAHELTIGRSDRSHKPELDLWPDLKVSREHARLWFAEGVWWIEDRGSAHGIRLAEEEIRGCGPVRLFPWSELRLGETRLLFAPASWRRIRVRSLIVDLELSPLVNLALVRAGVPLVSHVTVRNWGDLKTPRHELEFRVHGLATTGPISLTPLAPGESDDIENPKFRWESDCLETMTESHQVSIAVTVDGQPANRQQLLCRVLPANEWSLVPLRKHRLSLASFVFPNHPLIERTVAHALSRRSKSNTVVETVDAIYEHLREDWKIAYLPQPPSFETSSQRIRLPHHVLLDTAGCRGQGTCLDLALVIAACLEHLLHDPLIALIDLGSTWHAIVGYWTYPRPVLDPILANRQQLLEDSIWIEPNGVTRDPLQCSSADVSRTKARNLLLNRPLVFALDLRSARTIEGLQPQPYSVEPRFGDTVGSAIHRASRLNQQVEHPIGTVALLIGLLGDGQGFTAKLFDRFERDAAQDFDSLIKAHKQAPKPPAVREGMTANALVAIDLAKAFAKREGSFWVLEQHLLRGLISTAQQGAAVRKALEHLGLSPTRLQDEIDHALCRSGDQSSHFMSESPRPTAKDNEENTDTDD